MSIIPIRVRIATAAPAKAKKLMVEKAGAFTFGLSHKENYLIGMAPMSIFAKEAFS
jgi:hypothetical protein